MKKLMLILAITLFLLGCDSEEPYESDENMETDFTEVINEIDTDTDNDSFTESVDERELDIDNNLFSKSVDVFGITIIATARTPDDKLRYAANIMAQYLDNDEDGEVDNQTVVDTLVDQNATLFMFADDREAEEFDYDTIPDAIQAGQDLYASETNPNFNPAQENDLFDAALEEVLHLITHGGYAMAYPDVFGETPGTRIANAMDTARGGRFKNIPNEYPENAWYTYDDETCEYDCQIAEYFYWALTSHLGGQDYPGRAEEIEDEWHPNTPTALRQQDPAIHAILTDPAIILPTVLPDGSYSGMEIELQQ